MKAFDLRTILLSLVALSLCVDTANGEDTVQISIPPGVNASDPDIVDALVSEAIGNSTNNNNPKENAIVKKCVCRSASACPPRAPAKLMVADQTVCHGGYDGSCSIFLDTVTCMFTTETSSTTQNHPYLPDSIVSCEDGCTPLPKSFDESPPNGKVISGSGDEIEEESSEPSLTDSAQFFDLSESSDSDDIKDLVKTSVASKHSISTVGAMATAGILVFWEIF